MADPTDEARKSYQQVSEALGSDAAINPLKLIVTYRWEDDRATNLIQPPA